VATLAGPSGARAQDASRYYTVQHPDEFQIDWKAFYAKADRLTHAVRQRLPHALDLPYGDAPKQRLDVYGPPAGTRPGPVFLFLHGGGFREGDRAHYGYVADPLARHGIVTVVASYRLTPDAAFPEQPHDVVAMLGWVREHIAGHGGDPARVFVGGHSAGAILAASVSLAPDWLAKAGLPPDFIKGCVPVSGPSDVRNTPSLVAYAGDETRQAAASPLLHVVAPPPRTIVAVGSVERYVESSRALVDRVREKGKGAELIVLDGLPHDETAFALGDEKSPLTTAMIVMMTGRTP
jgi:acetyl esterase/lipase